MLKLIFHPKAGKKWPLQMSILSLIIIITNLVLITLLIVFSFNYLSMTSHINEKAEFLELYNTLKRSQLYCQIALATYTETQQSSWLEIFRVNRKQFEATLKTAYGKAEDRIVLNKLFDIDALDTSLSNVYEKILQLLEKRDYSQAKALVNDESYFTKINLLFRNLDALYELDGAAFTLQKVISQIQFLNDQLRLTIRFATDSGNANWEVQYIKAEEELTFLFKQAVILVLESRKPPVAGTQPWNLEALLDRASQSTSIDAKVISFLEDSNNQLVCLERKAFTAIKGNKIDEALKILSGDEYRRSNALYQKGLKSIGKILEQKKEQMLKDANEEIAVRIFIVALLLVILAIVWYFTFFIYRRLYIELLGSKQKLEDLNVTLEQKVEDSTNEIIRRSVTDELTGLPNRWKLEKDIKSGQWRALAIINIDHFSNYKAAFGPHLANQTLKFVAVRLSQILSDKGNLYKLSYDEFAFLSNDLDVMRNLLSAIAARINRPAIKVEGIHLHVSFGIGVVIDEETDLLRKANLALINAKQCGPGSLMVYKPEFDITKEYISNIEWIKKVQTALENDTIVPFFQGIRDNKTGVIDKFECLMRIKSNGQIISPVYFLEPARQAGLLPKLTDRMLEKSFLFFKNTPFDFSINISKEDLLDTNFIKHVTQKINMFAIDTGRITFEVLESMSFDQHTIIVDELKMLKALGFKLAIDDFGTAYSNFARLVEMNIDFLKIDGSFIKNIDTNKRSLEIVKSITSFCHNLNIKLVAEFVHAESVQTVVEGLGIDYSQGYYFSQPRESIA